MVVVDAWNPITGGVGHRCMKQKQWRFSITSPERANDWVPTTILKHTCLKHNWRPCTRQTMVDMFGWKCLVSSLARGSRVTSGWVIPLAC
jgi:hypothetical protein